MREREIQKVVVKQQMKNEPSQVGYWLSRSPGERIAALESIRREYNDWKYTDAEQRFQRVYRIVKLK